jgi:hypothetical protein
VEGQKLKPAAFVNPIRFRFTRVWTDLKGKQRGGLARKYDKIITTSLGLIQLTLAARRRRRPALDPTLDLAATAAA